ncbi:heat shock factor protein HSF30-like [Tasmannia lanceolata]|uniref:heat shock factor protein HSF30-like n=1 Tax=Tasmannia lanceolata TaxID=3420 RepID=UPI004063283D
MEGVAVKEEEMNGSSTLYPQPMEGLHDSGPPPFLTKTYDMVESSATDSIVSWSRTRNSFIVWDSHKFATNLLPKYFKHSNFSSFIRQLNTYGFRKVNPDRWEFANEGFLGGQKHLLKNIKRRRHVSPNMQQQGMGACMELGQLALEGEIEQLRRDHNVLMVEIVKLRQQQQNSRAKFITMEERLRDTERKQQQMMAFLARALKNPIFVQQLIQHRKQIELRGVGKKRRLPATLSSEKLEEFQGDATSVMGSRVLSYAQEENGFETEIGTLFSAIDNDAGNSSEDPDLGCMNDIMWEELLNEELITGNGEGHQVEIDVEVEDLAAKPANNFVDAVHVPVEQMGFA